MGIRGEIFSTKVLLQNRTYFFNVKENRMGDLYLNIVESKNRDTGGFDRQSVILFAEDLQEFLKGFDDSLRVVEKAIREQKKTTRRADRPGGTGFAEEHGGREDRGAPRRGGRAEGHRDGYRQDREGEFRGRAESPSRPRGGETPVKKTRRVVAKKRDQ
jgi:hypothetical protein